MPQTLRVPLKALTVVEQPDEYATSINGDQPTRTPAELDALEAKYRSAEQPLMVGIDQLGPAEPPPQAPTPEGRFDRATDVGPMVGSTVGAIARGPIGAAAGAAAGRGWQDLIEHAKEIPGAIVDVANNTIRYPKETFQGAVEGMASGAADAGLAASVGLGSEIAGNAAMKALGNTAKAVYRGYLKPSLAEGSIAKAKQIVDTAVEEGLTISREGVEKAQGIIGELKKEVDDILVRRQNISKQLFGDIDLHDVAEELRTWAKGKYFKPGRPSEDFDAAMRIADNIDAHASVPATMAKGPQPATLTEANQVKRTLYDSAGDKAFGMERAAGTEAEKQGARILKQGLEDRAPAIAPLNARESKLLDAVKAIKRAVEREQNQNALVGVKSVLAAGTGGIEYGRTGDPWSAAAKALVIRAALTPEAASRAAVLGYQISKKIPGVAPASAVRLALAAISEEGRDER